MPPVRDLFIPPFLFLGIVCFASGRPSARPFLHLQCDQAADRHPSVFEARGEEKCRCGNGRCRLSKSTLYASRPANKTRRVAGPEQLEVFRERARGRHLYWYDARGPAEFIARGPAEYNISRSRNH